MAPPYINNPENYYAIMECPITATPKVLRTSYKRLANLRHPDKSTHPDATAQFQQLGRAWECLKDEQMRLAYDVWWRHKYGPSPPSPTPQAAPQQQPRSQEGPSAASWSYTATSMNHTAEGTTWTSRTWNSRGESYTSTTSNRGRTTPSNAGQSSSNARTTPDRANSPPQPPQTPYRPTYRSRPSPSAHTSSRAALTSWKLNLKVESQRRHRSLYQDPFDQITKNKQDVKDNIDATNKKINELTSRLKRFAAEILERQIANLRLGLSTEDRQKQSMEDGKEGENHEIIMAELKELSTKLERQLKELDDMDLEIGEFCKRWEEKEYAARQNAASQAVTFLGLDQGDAGKAWAKLRGLEAGFSKTSGRVCAEWHGETYTTKLDGTREVRCGRCDERMYTSVAYHCFGCGILLCGDCKDALELLREYADWLYGRTSDSASVFNIY